MVLHFELSSVLVQLVSLALWKLCYNLKPVVNESHGMESNTNDWMFILQSMWSRCVISHGSSWHFVCVENINLVSATGDGPIGAYYAAGWPSSRDKYVLVWKWTYYMRWFVHFG